MKKVLIVDDNVSITKMLSKWLTAKGHEVTVSNDGKNGLTMILDNDFDMGVVESFPSNALAKKTTSLFPEFDGDTFDFDASLPEFQ